MEMEGTKYHEATHAGKLVSSSRYSHLPINAQASNIPSPSCHFKLYAADHFKGLHTSILADLIPGIDYTLNYSLKKGKIGAGSRRLNKAD